MNDEQAKRFELARREADEPMIKMLAEFIDPIGDPPNPPAMQLASTIVCGLRSVEGNSKHTMLTINPIADTFVKLAMEFVLIGTDGMGSREVWGYADSEDAESWQGGCGSREEAIAEAPAELGLEPGQAFYIQCGRKPQALEFLPDADWILEQMAEQAGNEGGEAAEEFPDVTDEGKAELNRYLQVWATKHAEPVSFWIADGNCERIEPVTPTTETVGGTE